MAQLNSLSENENRTFLIYPGSEVGKLTKEKKALLSENVIFLKRVYGFMGSCAAGILEEV